LDRFMKICELCRAKGPRSVAWGNFLMGHVKEVLESLSKSSLEQIIIF
jgi:hypothetical protein